MPYLSRAQQGLFHSENSPVSEAVTKKFDKASKGQHGLPYHVGAKHKLAQKLASKKKDSDGDYDDD